MQQNLDNYGTLLLIFKVLSDALSAGFGVFGLLTEFKDKHHRITRNGKIALIGIVATFGISAVITFLEQKEGDKREASTKAWYEQQFRRRPIADVHGQFDFKSTEGFPVTSGERPFLFHPEFEEAELQKVPHVIRLFFYRNSVPCKGPDIISSPTGPLWNPRPDLILSPGPSDSTPKPTMFDLFYPRSLSSRQTLTFTTEQNTTALIESVEDIPGTTIMIQASGVTTEKEYKFGDAQLRFAKGVPAVVVAGSGVTEWSGRGQISAPPVSADWNDQRFYCYTFPSN